MARIRTAVEALPGRRGEILKLNKLEDVPKDEIAEKMGLSVRTVEKHLELAMKELRRKMN